MRMRAPSMAPTFRSGTSSEGAKRLQSHVAVPSTTNQNSPCINPAMK